MYVTNMVINSIYVCSNLYNNVETYGSSFSWLLHLESSVLIDKIVMNTDNACKVAWEKLRLIIKGN